MDSRSETSIIKRRFSTRDVFGILIALAMGLLSLVSWQVFFTVTLNPDIRNTVTALFWFSLLGAAFFLGTVVWKERFTQLIAPVLVFLPSFLFVQNWYHFIFVVIAVMLGYLSIRFVQDEVEDRVRFRFIKHVQSGSFMFVLGLSIALSSAYFVTIQNETWEELVPRFSVGQGTAAVTIKAIAYFYPPWKNLADEGMTVDGFLLSLQKKNEEAGVLREEVKIDPVAFPGLAEYLRENVVDASNYTEDGLSQELYLRAGREQIAKLSGTEIRGGEKITDVFTSAMQHRIIVVLNGEQASRHLTPAIVPVVLAFLMFLTLLPLGAVMGYFWLGLSYLIFQIALFFGWTRLERVMREQEILAP